MFKKAQAAAGAGAPVGGVGRTPLTRSVTRTVTEASDNSGCSTFSSATKAAMTFWTSMPLAPAIWATVWPAWSCVRSSVVVMPSAVATVSDRDAAEDQSSGESRSCDQFLGDVFHDVLFGWRLGRWRVQRKQIDRPGLELPWARPRIG